MWDGMCSELKFQLLGIELRVPNERWHVVAEYVLGIEMMGNFGSAALSISPSFLP